MREQKRNRTTIYLPGKLWRATKIMAIERDCAATDLVVKALEQYLKKGGRS